MVGITEALGGKWPLRDGIGRSADMFWGKKLNREVTVATGGQDD